MKTGLANLWTRLKRKGIAYWLRAALVLAIAFAVEHYTATNAQIVQARYAIFQGVSQALPRPLQPRSLKTVLIQDDEYWRGPLAHRSPTKRDYLARLVRRLDAADASLIALDFDLPLDPAASGRPGDFAELPDYKSETDDLIRALLEAAGHHRKIVLSKNIVWQAGYRLRADVFQLYGLCTGFDAAGGWRNPGIPGFPTGGDIAANISCGYIALPFDMRRLPPPLPVGDGHALDSFSLAIARAINPQIVAEQGAGAYYGSYLPEAVLEKYGAKLSAAGVLRGAPAVLEAVRRSKGVIIGADWHQGGYGEGAREDAHATPVGELNGTLIHADFAEAVLDSRIYGYVPGWVLLLCELTFSLVTGIAFAIVGNPWAKLAAFAGITVLLLAVQWLMLVAIGIFFEAFIPIAGLWIHSLIERLVGGEHEKA